ncbi:MAG: exonuclease VII large subunit [Prevotella sp.]|nr:exonuclease VII large subunit [Prevotella sp.]
MDSQEQKALATTSFYKPSEILRIFNDYLARTSVSAKLVCLRGIFLKSASAQPYGGFFYDKIRDENTADEMSIKTTQAQRKELKNGNLIDVAGTIERRIGQQGTIILCLCVTRVNIVQAQAVSEQEVKRNALWEMKRQQTKNVDAIIERMLFEQKKPVIALVLPTASIVLDDFNAAKGIASSRFQFEEYKVAFGKSTELAALLRKLDMDSFAAIAIVRGGGGQDALDDYTVLETVARLNTPFISAIGHEAEKFFIKSLADKVVVSPTDLGNYFREMIERVDKSMNDSMAILRNTIKKQYDAQIEAANKQNKGLQEKIAQLTKSQEEGQKLQKQQLEEAKKQNEGLQKQLAELTASNKKTSENIAAMTANLASANKTIESLQKQLDTSNGGVSKVLFYSVIAIAVLVVLLLLIFYQGEM